MTNVEGDVGHFDIIAETLRATNLGQLKEESHINFERQAIDILLKACCVT